MRRILLHVLMVLALAGLARADSTMQSVQQALKNQKVYYGKITGEKNAETTAAIRRYQIRSGLQVTGEINPETLHSLNVHSSSVPATSKPAIAQSNNVGTRDDAKTARNFPITDQANQNSRVDQNSLESPSTEPDRQFDTNPGYAAAYYKSVPTRMNKRMLVAEIQRQLMTRGYYRGSVDGRYGRQTALGLRAFQFSSGLPATGRLDTATVNALGISDQNVTSYESPRRANETWVPISKFKHGKWKVKWKKYKGNEGDEYGDAEQGENGRAWWNAVGQDE